MAATPPKSEGPLCEECNKPMNDHSFEDQIKCMKSRKKRQFKK